jgi:hypothetical protein
MSLLALELLVIAALWGWWAWKNPKEAFIGLPILLPAYVVRTKIGPIPTTGLELAIIAMLIAWVAKRVTRASPLRILRRFADAWRAFGAWQWPAMAWLAAGLIAVLIAPDKIAALGLYRAYFIEPILIFFMGFDVIRSHDDRKALASNFGFIAMVIAVWAVVQYLTGWGIPSPWDALEGRRATGPFPFPNALALFMAPIAALAFADRIRAQGTGHRAQGSDLESLMSPILGWLTMISGVAAMILAKSDGGLIAFGAAAFVALLFNKRMRIPAIAVAVIVSVLIFALPQTRAPALERITFKEWSGKVRLVMWGETVEMLKDRPILGAGLGAYPMVIAPYHKADWMEVFQYPHNILLNLWSEAGLFGVLVFGWILWRWMRDEGWGMKEEKSTRVFRLSPLALPIIAAILVHGLVDVPYFKNDLAVAFWLFILITIPFYAKEPHRH